MFLYAAGQLASSPLHQVGAVRMQRLPFLVLLCTIGGTLSVMHVDSVEDDVMLEEDLDMQKDGGQRFVRTDDLRTGLLRTSARYTVFGEPPLEARLPPIETRDTRKQAMELFAFWKSEGAVQDRSSIVLAQTSKAPTYLTFDTDAGGLNNMRMLFEYAVHLAATTGRALILPPKEGWYLVDWGPLNARNKTDQGWIDTSHKTWSNYQEFWDIDDLRNYISVAPAISFFQREQEQFQIPDAVNPSKVPPSNSPDPNAWKDWLFQHAQHAVGCEASLSLASGDAPLVHLPMKSKKGDDPEYRYFDCKPKDRGETLVHFNPRYFNMVSKLLGGEATVKDLKFGSYAAIHLRRNDFQYKQAPSVEGGKAILAQLSRYIHPGDPVYIASDEVDSSWWDGFRSALKQNHTRLISLQDYKTDLEKMGATRRHLGTIEMIICAGAKVFFGTPLSTFSVGIHKIRDGIYNDQKRRHKKSDLDEKDPTNAPTMYHGEKLFIDL
eukprot:TRINITY_DN3655_c0_g2_i1.p1 TRINITY_DN3655_c0_g2~~TRINITY_DN3655_c0_g2_i1.p1  ORF type:complete len:493 (+),score=78.94 TRINITY_DN3655_c0_g2_i1:53-1531(+)